MEIPKFVNDAKHGEHTGYEKQMAKHSEAPKLGSVCTFSTQEGTGT